MKSLYSEERDGKRVVVFWEGELAQDGTPVEGFREIVLPLAVVKQLVALDPGSANFVLE